ncbi:unnamed protein product [Leuciscus chuanchicus]
MTTLICPPNGAEQLTWKDTDTEESAIGGGSLYILWAHGSSLNTVVVEEDNFNFDSPAPVPPPLAISLPVVDRTHLSSSEACSCLCSCPEYTPNQLDDLVPPCFLPTPLSLYPLLAPSSPLDSHALLVPHSTSAPPWATSPSRALPHSTLSSPFELFNVEVRRGEVVLLVKPGPVCSTKSTKTFSFPTIRSTTSHIPASTKGVSSPSACLPLPLSSTCSPSIIRQSP